MIVDWTPFLATFGLIFLAELGDKTQIAAMCQAAQFRSPWLVLLGASAALTIVSAVGVVIGHFAGACFPRESVRYVAAGLFILMGVLMALKVI